MENDIHDGNAVELEIDGILDLHTFSPRDLKHLIPDYLDECRRKNIAEVRIIHGKGTGVLRRTVHALLEKLPHVVSFKLATSDHGNWGATIVQLDGCGYKSDTENKTDEC